jgi:hypothetical protein
MGRPPSTASVRIPSRPARNGPGSFESRRRTSRPARECKIATAHTCCFSPAPHCEALPGFTRFRDVRRSSESGRDGQKSHQRARNSRAQVLDEGAWCYRGAIESGGRESRRHGRRCPASLGQVTGRVDGACHSRARTSLAGKERGLRGRLWRLSRWLHPRAGRSGQASTSFRRAKCSSGCWPSIVRPRDKEISSVVIAPCPAWSGQGR